MIIVVKFPFAGGPGCGKGTVVQNLAAVFNFKFIGAQHVILKNISKKLHIPGNKENDFFNYFACGGRSSAFI